MYNNCSATLKQKDIEDLEVEEVTYNFEVEDFHTYYVGENSVLVHNICTKVNTKKYNPDILSTKNLKNRISRQNIEKIFRYGFEHQRNN